MNQASKIPNYTNYYTVERSGSIPKGQSMLVKIFLEQEKYQNDRNLLRNKNKTLFVLIYSLEVICDFLLL